MTKRKAGLLMPVSSIPGQYGIGDFGSTTIEAIKIVEESGFKLWQVLPLGPLGYGNSPYQSYSSYAIDPIYIDVDDLYERKLIRQLPLEIEQTSKVDYEAVRKLKVKQLEIAVTNFVPTASYQRFIEHHTWLEEYAKFMVLKERDESKIWYQWEEEVIDYHNLSYDFPSDRIKFYQISQYLLFKQWEKIRSFANRIGIKVIGDIPIYVSIDSHDVWAHRENYQLASDGRPTHVAGVPPDYFSADGQLWGNPLYDWNQLERDGFKFWIDRIAHNSRMFDVTRIDHFRAFDSYWSIPAGNETAREGEWKFAPGHNLFNKIFEHFDREQIVVEDLGEMRPEVFQLRDDFGLTGMKIVQFSLDPNEMNNNFDDYENLIVYTGTHDNQTLVGWYNDLSQSEKANLIAIYGVNPPQEIIKQSFKSVANYVIIPVQDIILADDSARFNTPGTVNDINWTWNLQSLKLIADKADQMKQVITAANR